MSTPQERAAKRTEENKRIKEFFIGFMKAKLYEVEGKKMFKGYVVINLMNGGRKVRATDTNPNHKFPHIVTCLTPTNREQAEALYFLLELEKKEMGKEAYDKMMESKRNNE